MLGVAEGGLARSCHLIADQNVHNKRGLESILQVYSFRIKPTFHVFEKYFYLRTELYNILTTIKKAFLYLQ